MGIVIEPIKKEKKSFYEKLKRLKLEKLWKKNDK